ncbi:MAG: bifunctional molybdenum cofactor biosynthesis protein MoaC/MoaB [Flavitalea sp.]
MVNITHKINTLRKAVASAVVLVSAKETIEAVIQKKVPKGDVFEFSRAAGLLAIKKTSDVIPDCHPLPVEFAAIAYKADEANLRIVITVEVHTIYKTGVEVEAMHGAAITALTVYDMLKPIDKGVQIASIKLEEKKGGKSDSKMQAHTGLTCAVIVCSDSISKGLKEDESGKTIIKKLSAYQVDVALYEVIPDDIGIIREKARQLSDEGYKLIIFTGGTGLSPRDVTPEALAPLIDRPVPGIMETARNYGQQRMPHAMLSRGIAGFIKNTFALTLPGSTKGAAETIDALFPQILHVFEVQTGERHANP